MRKLVFVFVLTIQGLYHTYGQDPHFTQFYANPLYLNPAMAGSTYSHRVTSNYRNQWPNISGSYVTYAASYDGFFESVSGGLGFQMMYDRAGEGELSTMTSSFIYAYQLNVSRTFAIKAGLQYQLQQRSIDFSKLLWYDQIEPRKGFTLPPSTTVPTGYLKTRLMNDFSAGLLGFTKKFYAGVAVHHINEPEASFFSNSKAVVPRKYTFHAGMQIPLDAERKPKHYFSPNILIMNQDKFTQSNIGAYYINDYIVGGVWYRITSKNTDGFMFLIGLKRDPVKIGYSYDITTSDVHGYSIGSHEISLTFDFKTYKKPVPIKWRKLICPTF